MPGHLHFPVLAAVTLTLITAPATAGAQGSGDVRDLYQTRCADCHGEDASGELPGVPDLTQAPEVWARTDDTLLARTIAGVDSPASPIPMPPRGGHPDLSDAELRTLIIYMRTLATGQAH